jgi:hypothetical protein
MEKRVTDIIKVLMVFFVFGIHILLNFRVDANSSFPIFYNMIELFLRPCINILFLITGYGLITNYKEKSHMYFLEKFIYFTIESIIFLLAMNVFSYILLKNEILVANHFSPWFLFAYTLIPFILMIFKYLNIELEKIKNFFILFLFVSILLTFSTNVHTGSIPYPFISFEYFSFVFIGYFVIPRFLKKDNKKFIIFSLLYLVLSLYIYKEHISELNNKAYLYNYFYQYFSPHVILLTFFEFLLLYKLFEKLKMIKLNVPTFELYLVSGYSIGFVDYLLFNNSILVHNYNYIFKVWIYSFLLGIVFAYLISFAYKHFYNNFVNKIIKKHITI